MLLSRGNKATEEESEGDEQDLTRTEECLENLKALLGLERVILSTKISKGIYEKDKKRVKILSHSGKWNVGYYEDQVNYLRPHEALYQIEMRKLEMTFDNVIVSVEQAYAIFLDPGSFQEYLVYANLIRAGYFVEQHDPLVDTQKYEALVNKMTVNKEDNMIWAVLMEKLNQPISTEFISQEHQLYEQTKAAMEVLSEKISGVREENNTNGRCTAKRDLSPEECMPSKRHKPDIDEHQDHNFLDILKAEVEYSTYQESFKKLSFIKRSEDAKIPDRSLKFNFDVFLPKTNFKRTEDLPNYRIVVIR